MTTRREFLKQSGAALAGVSMLGSAARLIAAPAAPPAAPPAKAAGKPTLVVIYLRGGADILNTIVPYSDPEYYKLRPILAVPPRDLADQEGSGALRLNDTFGLHPAMKPLLPMFMAGSVAPIINVGSPSKTRSHFDAQDFMERAAPDIRSITEGWINRYLYQTRQSTDAELRALALQPTLPRSLRGQYPVLAARGYGAEDSTLKSFEPLYGKATGPAATPDPEHAGVNEKSLPPACETELERIEDSGQNTIRRLRELAHIIAADNPNAGLYPKTGLAGQLRSIAQVIRAGRGLEVAAVDYGGWDHHAMEGGAKGAMYRVLGELSSALAAFMTDLGPRMDRVLVLTMSEFGRTAKENGDDGTDHGHGGFMLAAGGMVRGRRVHGRWMGLDSANLYENRDLPVTTDFRVVMAEALGRLYKFDAIGRNFFPEWRPQTAPLNFLNGV